MTYKISSDIQALQIAASKGDNRPNIEGVHFNCRVAASTNGKILAMAKLPDGEENPKGTILKFSSPKQAKFSTYSTEETYTRIGESEKLIGQNTKNVAEVVDGQFPQYEQVIPKKPEKPFVVTISAALLKQLADAIGVDKRGGVTLGFNADDPMSAIVVSSVLAPDKAGVIMPMMGDSKVVADIWNTITKLTA